MLKYREGGMVWYLLRQLILLHRYTFLYLDEKYSITNIKEIWVKHLKFAPVSLQKEKDIRELVNSWMKNVCRGSKIC